MRVPDLSTPCIEWEGTLTTNGYGRGWVDGKEALMHRVAWEDANRPIPDGLVIDHLCRNRRCRNHLHLEPVTTTVNILRGEGPGAINARKTHCKNGHPLEGDNLMLRSNGRWRRCRACHVETGRRTYQRRIAST